MNGPANRSYAQSYDFQFLKIIFLAMREAVTTMFDLCASIYVLMSPNMNSLGVATKPCGKVFTYPPTGPRRRTRPYSVHIVFSGCLQCVHMSECVRPIWNILCPVHCVLWRVLHVVSCCIRIRRFDMG